MNMDELERRYDGAVPQRLKDIVIHGSRLKADIAEVENLVKFYTEQVLFHERAANSWLAAAGGHAQRRAHNLGMARCNQRYATEARRSLSQVTTRLLDLKRRVVT